MKINRRKLSRVLVWMLILVIMTYSAFPPPGSRAQTPSRIQKQAPTRRGQTVKRFRPAAEKVKRSLKAQGQPRPAWVNQALDHSLTLLERRKARYALTEVAADLSLLSAEQDDLDQTHLRLAQWRNGVEVFGGQLVSHVKGGSAGSAVTAVGGRTFDVSQVDTTPKLTKEQAVEATKIAHQYEGALGSEPEVKLFILPHSIFDYQATDEATLTWRVTLRVEDGTERSGLFYYFIDAVDGHVVWRQNGSESGSGASLYHGSVPVSSFWLGSYHMTDIARGSSKVFDLNNAASGDGDHFIDDDDNWGDGTVNDRQSAAVDAQHSVARTWDYFQNVFGRRGMDGFGSPVTSKVHWGMNTDNARREGGTSHLAFGDGDGVTTSAWVSLDVVAHEFTHGVTYNTANLIYQNESGAINESFSDIFATAAEWNAGNNPDYLLFEDIYLPGAADNAARDMSNPTRLSISPPDTGTIPYPDHSSLMYTGSWDNGGVHINSSIMNHAFYLLAEGGVNTSSNVAVPGIGRRNAELIFYRALTFYLFPTAKFHDARVATVNAAADLFGLDSNQHRATQTAWEAVGMSAPDLFFYNANDGSAAAVGINEDHYSGETSLFTRQGYGPGALANGWSDIVPVRNFLFFYNRGTGSYAVAKLDERGNMQTVDTGQLPGWMTKVVGTNTHILFQSGYDRSGLIGSVNSTSGQFFVTQSFGPGAFGSWSHIVDTPYGMFFYNFNDGTIGMARVQLNGTLLNTDLKYRYAGAGYDRIVAQGSNLVLYDADTGRYEVGYVDQNGVYGNRPLTSCSPKLQPGYWMVTGAGGKVFFYNPNTGAAALGLTVKSIFSSPCGSPFVLQKTYAFGPGWTNLVNTTNGLFFYCWRNGLAAVGRFAADGTFNQTGTFWISPNWSSAITTEK